MKKKLTKTQKVLVSVLIIAGLIVCGIFIFKPDYERFEEKEQAFMFEITKGGEPEMLLITFNFKTRLTKLKLVRLNHDKPIWETAIKESRLKVNGRISTIDSIAAVGYYTYPRPENKGTYGLEAFNIKTGEKLWEYAMEESKNISSTYWIKAYSNNFYVFTKDPNNKNRITCLNPENGERNWDISFKDYSIIEQLFLNNHLILKTYNDICVIDVETGTYQTLSGEYNSPFAINDSEFIVLKQDSLFSYNTNINVLTFLKTIEAYKGKEDELRKSAMFNDEMLCIREDSLHHSYLSSFSIGKEDDYKEFHFDNGMNIQYIFYEEVQFDNPESCGFYHIQSRYIPLIIEKGRGKYNAEKQIVIFDLEEWKPLWSSKLLITGSTELLTQYIWYHKGYYALYLDFTNDGKSKPGLVTFNCKTGKFNNAIYLSPNASILRGFIRLNAMFSENYFYGSDLSDAWCLSFPKLELMYSSDKEMRVINAKKEVEELYGEIEWE